VSFLATTAETRTHQLCWHDSTKLKVTPFMVRNQSKRMTKHEILLLLILIKASFAKHSAASCGSSMCLMRFTASWFFITCKYIFRFMIHCVLVTKYYKLLDILGLTSHMPLLARIKNSVSESILSPPTTSSEPLDCFVPVVLPDSQAIMRTFVHMHSNHCEMYEQKQVNTYG